MPGCTPEPRAATGGAARTAAHKADGDTPAAVAAAVAALASAAETPAPLPLGQLCTQDPPGHTSRAFLSPTPSPRGGREGADTAVPDACEAQQRGAVSVAEVHAALARSSVSSGAQRRDTPPREPRGRLEEWQVGLAWVHFQVRGAASQSVWHRKVHGAPMHAGMARRRMRARRLGHACCSLVVPHGCRRVRAQRAGMPPSKAAMRAQRWQGGIGFCAARLSIPRSARSWRQIARQPYSKCVASPAGARGSARSGRCAAAAPKPPSPLPGAAPRHHACAVRARRAECSGCADSGLDARRPTSTEALRHEAAFIALGGSVHGHPRGRHTAGTRCRRDAAARLSPAVRLASAAAGARRGGQRAWLRGRAERGLGACRARAQAPVRCEFCRLAWPAQALGSTCSFKSMVLE